MTSQTRPEPLCPRCYAPLSPDLRHCEHCGATVVHPEPTGDDGAICPHCQPRGVARLRSAGRAVLDTDQVCPQCLGSLVLAEGGRVVAYDERALDTTTFDLEKVIRAEAVDGWELVDTTFDGREPHRVHAHFRRALGPDDPRSIVAEEMGPLQGRDPSAPDERLDPASDWLPTGDGPSARPTRRRQSGATGGGHAWLESTLSGMESWIFGPLGGLLEVLFAIASAWESFGRRAGGATPPRPRRRKSKRRR